jgi:hypothetical protein
LGGTSHPGALHHRHADRLWPVGHRLCVEKTSLRLLAGASAAGGMKSSGNCSPAPGHGMHSFAHERTPSFEMTGNAVPHQQCFADSGRRGTFSEGIIVSKRIVISAAPHCSALRWWPFLTATGMSIASLSGNSAKPASPVFPAFPASQALWHSGQGGVSGVSRLRVLQPAA